MYCIIDFVVSSKVSIFITGESGIGKEVCVEVIYVVSKCGDKLFIVINCVVILKDLIESELFGYVKGVFIGVVIEC